MSTATKSTNSNGTASLDSSTDNMLTENLLSAEQFLIEETNNGETTRNDENCDLLSSSSFSDPLHDATPYLLDPKRFLVLALFSLNNMLPSACWITFAPIEDAVRIYYGGISAQQVNWLSTIMMAAYGPGTLAASWAIPKFGMRNTVVASSVLISFGALLRLASILFRQTNPSWAYALVLSGQGICSLGQSVFSNAPARVASTWFPKTTQPIGVVILSATVGMATAQATSPLWVEESTGAGLDQILAGQALAIVLCTIATWWWFESQPAFPPSAAEAAKRRQPAASQNSTTTATASLARDVWKLFADPQMQLLLAAFGIAYGVNNACLTLLQPWIASSGYKGDKIAGLCGSLSIAGGVLGNLIAAPLLEASQNYNQAIRWSYATAFFVAVATVASLQVVAPVGVLATVFFALGMTQLPLTTIAMDAAAAHSYPIPEDLSTAGLQMVGQYLGVILISIMGGMIHEDGPRGFAAPVNIAFLGLLALSAAIAMCYNGDDPRGAANRRNVGTNDSQVDVETTREA